MHGNIEPCVSLIRVIVSIQARDGLIQRAEQAEAQAASSRSELDAAQSALSSAQQEAAATAAALQRMQEQHAARQAQLEADLHRTQEQQRAQSHHASEVEIEQQVAARLAGEASLFSLQDAGNCHDAD